MRSRAGMVGLGMLVLAIGVSVVVAQPGGQGPGGPGRGGMGMGMGRGMMGGFAFGSVTDGNLDQGWITVEMQMPGGGPGPGMQGMARTVNLTQNTGLLSVQTATLADLKVGDGLMVSGVPTGITANRLLSGPNTVPAAQAMNLIGAFTGMAGPGAMRMMMGGPQANDQVVPPPSASAAGKVVGLDPLRIQVSAELTLEVNVTPDATFTKVTEVPWNSVNVGTQVFCLGQPGQNDALDATVVVIVPEGMQMGPGAFGGFGGFGGPPGGRQGRRGGQ